MCTLVRGRDLTVTWWVHDTTSYYFHIPIKSEFGLVIGPQISIIRMIRETICITKRQTTTIHDISPTDERCHASRARKRPVSFPLCNGRTRWVLITGCADLSCQFYHRRVAAVGFLSFLFYSLQWSLSHIHTHHIIFMFTLGPSSGRQARR